MRGRRAGKRVLRELESIMGRLAAMVQGEEFHPARSQERFRVAMTDHGSTILLPALLERVRKAAPHARLEISAWRTQAYEDVVAGRIDLALSAEAVPPTLESEVIFNLDFVCLVGSTQPVRKRRFTLKQYLQLPHALVETLGGQQTMVDRPLAQLGAKRRVALRLPFFLPAIFAIAKTDLGPDGPSQVSQDHRSDSWSARGGTAARDRSFSVLRCVAFAPNE